MTTLDLNMNLDSKKDFINYKNINSYASVTYLTSDAFDKINTNLLPMQRQDREIRIFKERKYLTFKRVVTTDGLESYDFSYSDDAGINVNILINELTMYLELFRDSTIISYLQSRYGLLVSKIMYAEIREVPLIPTMVLQLLILRRAQGSRSSLFVSSISEKYAPLNFKEETPSTFIGCNNNLPFSDYSTKGIPSFELPIMSLSNLDISNLRYTGNIPKDTQVYTSTEASNLLVFANSSVDDLPTISRVHAVNYELQMTHSNPLTTLPKFKSTYLRGAHSHLVSFICNGSSDDLPEHIVHPEIKKVLNYSASFTNILSNKSSNIEDVKYYLQDTYAGTKQVTILQETATGVVNFNDKSVNTHLRSRFIKDISETKFFNKLDDPYMERTFIQSARVRQLCTFNNIIVSNYVDMNSVDSYECLEGNSIDFNLGPAFSGYRSFVSGTAREDLVGEYNLYPRDTWAAHASYLESLINSDLDSDTLALYKLQITLVKLARNTLREISFTDEYTAYLLRDSVAYSVDIEGNLGKFYSDMLKTSQALVSLAYIKKSVGSNCKLRNTAVHQRANNVFKSYWKKNVTSVARSSIANIITIDWASMKHRLDTSYPLNFSTLCSKALSIVAAHHDCVENRLKPNFFEAFNFLSLDTELPVHEFTTSIVTPGKDGRVGESYGLYTANKKVRSEINTVSKAYRTWFLATFEDLFKVGTRCTSDNLTDITFLQRNARMAYQYGNMKAVALATAKRVGIRRIKGLIAKEKVKFDEYKLYVDVSVEAGYSAEQLAPYKVAYQESKDKLRKYQVELAELAPNTKEARSKRYVRNSMNFANIVHDIVKHTTRHALKNLDTRFKEAVDQTKVSEPLSQLCTSAFRSIVMPEIIEKRAEWLNKYIDDLGPSYSTESKEESLTLVKDKIYELAEKRRSEFAIALAAMITALPAVNKDPIDILEAVSLEGAGISIAAVTKLLRPVTVQPTVYRERISSLAALANAKSATAMEEVTYVAETLLSRKYFAGMGTTPEGPAMYNFNEFYNFSKAMSSVESELARGLR